ncbi:MAG: pilus assembly protein N-terminal domain-containing protein [Betaproteobacteria bacterium]|nr:pilus assembly protein N-terminal domain-containing protein [Betaproteobacteria bacterium]
MKEIRQTLGSAILRRSLTVALALLVGAGPMLAQAAPQAASAIRERSLTMYDGQVLVLPVAGVHRIAIGNGKILGATALKHHLLLMGTGTGTTDLFVWTKHDGMTAYHVFLDDHDNTQTYQQLKAVLGRIPGLEVRDAGGRVVLAGNLNPGDAKLVAQIAKTFPGTVNMARADDVNMKRMVYLDVQVVDFKKSALSSLGIQWQTSMAGPSLGLVGDFYNNNNIYRMGSVDQGGGGNTLNGVVSGQPGPLTGLPLHINPMATYFGLVTSLTSQINLAEQNGGAYVLANPQLSTRSGETASFLAGGEVPIPISSALGQTSVIYKKYGVMLNIQPTADRHGNILASIKTEVSQIDPSVTVNGYPGFLSRKTQSVVNVHSGQTIVLSGLMHSVGSDTINKFPWLGDIPVLGWLFKSKDFQASRSELVIFVTPVVFNPQSTVNKEAIGRATTIIHGFNDMAGKGLYMPGFGVGPGSHPQPPVAETKSSPAAAAPQTAAVGTPTQRPALPQPGPAETAAGVPPVTPQTPKAAARKAPEATAAHAAETSAETAAPTGAGSPPPAAKALPKTPAPGQPAAGQTAAAAKRLGAQQPGAVTLAADVAPAIPAPSAAQATKPSSAADTATVQP